jgi:Acetyltransferase (GNAT) domain
METETARLILRRPTLADVPALFEFLRDADAMRYTHVDASLRQCRRRIAAHERRRRRDGYAPWTIVITTRPGEGWLRRGSVCPRDATLPLSTCPPGWANHRIAQTPQRVVSRNSNRGSRRTAACRRDSGRGRRMTDGKLDRPVPAAGASGQHAWEGECGAGVSRAMSRPVAARLGSAEDVAEPEAPVLRQRRRGGATPLSVGGEAPKASGLPAGLTVSDQADTTTMFKTGGEA